MKQELYDLLFQYFSIIRPPAENTDYGYILIEIRENEDTLATEAAHFHPSIPDVDTDEISNEEAKELFFSLPLVAQAAMRGKEDASNAIHDSLENLAVLKILRDKLGDEVTFNILEAKDHGALQAAWEKLQESQEDIEEN